MKARTFPLHVAERIVSGECLIDTSPRYRHLRGEIVIHGAGLARPENGGPKREGLFSDVKRSAIYKTQAARSGLVGVATLEEIVPADRVRVESNLGTQWRWDLPWLLVDRAAWDLARTGRKCVYLFSGPIAFAERVKWPGNGDRTMEVLADGVCPTCRALVRYDYADPRMDALDLHTWWHMPADFRAVVANARAMP